MQKGRSMALPQGAQPQSTRIPGMPIVREIGGRVTRTVRPGQDGVQGLTFKYGAALVCVRYRDDPARGRRYTTVELIVAERIAPVVASGRDDDPSVAIRISFDETELRRLVKDAGGKWDANRRVWRVERSVVSRLGLRNRIVNMSDGV